MLAKPRHNKRTELQVCWWRCLRCTPSHTRSCGNYSGYLLSAGSQDKNGVACMTHLLAPGSTCNRNSVVAAMKCPAYLGDLLMPRLRGRLLRALHSVRVFPQCLDPTDSHLFMYGSSGALRRYHAGSCSPYNNGHGPVARDMYLREVPCHHPGTSIVW